MSYIFAILPFLFAMSWAYGDTTPSPDLNKMRVSTENLQSSIKTLEQRMTSLETKHKTLEENSEFGEELSTLKLELQTLKAEGSSGPAPPSSQSETALLTRTVIQLSENVVSLLQENCSQFPEIRRDINSLRSSLQDLSRRAVTDIKLGPAEQADLWRNRGYFDQVPYVITEVSNFNSDAYPDVLVRRSLMKLINGTWTNLGSG